MRALRGLPGLGHGSARQRQDEPRRLAGTRRVEAHVAALLPGQPPCHGQTQALAPRPALRPE